MHEFTPVAGPAEPSAIEPGALSSQAKLELLLGEIARQAADPPSGDKIIQAAWQAYPRIIEIPGFHDATLDWLGRCAIKQHPSDPTGVSISQLARTQGAHLAYSRMQKAPTLLGHEDSGKWLRGTQQMVRDTLRFEQYMIAQRFPLNTSVPDRYSVAHILAEIMAGNGQPVPIVDAGTGVMFGLNRLGLKNQYPFPDVTVLRPAGASGDGKPRWRPGAPAVQAAYSALLDAPRPPGKLMGIDILDMVRDPIIMELARAALRPQSEIRNPAFMRTFRQLAGAKLPPEAVRFVVGDITDRQEMQEIMDKYPQNKARLLFASTVGSQLGEDRLNPMVESLMTLLDGETYKDAMVLLLDFVYPDPADPSQVRSHTRWDAGTYAAIGIYKNDPSRQARVLFRYPGSRPTEVIIGQDELMRPEGSGIEYMTVRDALLRRARQLREV